MHRGYVFHRRDAVDDGPIWPEAAAAMNDYGKQRHFSWLDALYGSP